MSGSRSDWARLLPVIQAFVAGEPIERRDYDRRWKPTDTMRDLLCGEKDKYRIAPPGVRRGIWTVLFTETIHGAVDGPIKTGTLTWKGSDHDTPPWPTGPNIQIDMNTESFTEIVTSEDDEGDEGDEGDAK